MPLEKLRRDGADICVSEEKGEKGKGRKERRYNDSGKEVKRQLILRTVTERGECLG